MHISYILSYKKKLVSALLAPPIVAYASIVLRGGVDVKSKTMLLLFFIFLYNSYKIITNFLIIFISHLSLIHI